MILYLLKSTLCMALLYGVYILIFEKEKMHRFNRFYLIFSLVFSLVIPTIAIDFTPTAINRPLYEFENSISSPLPAVDESIPSIAQLPSQRQAINYTTMTVYLGIIVYLLVVALLFYRLLRNMYFLLSKIKKGNIVEYERTKLVLIENQISPHSFLGHIFIHEDNYQDGCIDEHILTHELTHIRQRHSIDILFVEILKVVFWFNPVLHYYKKAMQLNHEFLADQSVIDAVPGISKYQSFLLNQIDLANNPALASSLNYSLTKKRLTMMRKKTSRMKALLIQVSILPLLAIFVFVFSVKVEAQDAQKKDTSSLVQEILELSRKQSLTDEERKRLGKATLGLFNAQGIAVDDDQARFLNLMKVYNAKLRRYTSDIDTGNASELQAIHAVLKSSYDKFDTKWKNSLNLLPPPPPPMKVVVKEKAHPHSSGTDKSGYKVISKDKSSSSDYKISTKDRSLSSGYQVISKDLSLSSTYEALLKRYNALVHEYLKDGRTDEQLKNVLSNLDSTQKLYAALDEEDKKRLAPPPPPPPVKRDQLARVRKQLNNKIPPPPPPKKN